MLSYHTIKDLPARKLTRLAPTPSGFLHLGNALSFAITAHFAQRTNAEILLRIDDLDPDRTQDYYIQDIFDTLKFLDIPWQAGPKNKADFLKNWSQSTRMDAYEKSLKQLAESGKVFGCTCSRSKKGNENPDGRYTGTCISKKINLNAPQVQWRMITRPGKILEIARLGGSSIKSTLPSSMQNFVVRRKDKIPAYQLASLIDDELFGVDMIVRGIDLWPSSWAQLYTAEVLERITFQKTLFVHHPLLMDKHGAKLSKSAGATSIHFLRNQGADAASVYNQIAQMLGARQTCRNWMELGNLVEKMFAP